jgi:glycosyltransferase involved in cell wall biosynthesis
MVIDAANHIEVANRAALVKEPLVSVHMITYNHEAYLTDAIEGVVRQKTEYPFELIIGEDCSKDKTRGIALAYQRRHPDKIAVLYSGSNVGPFANSRRVHLKQRGKYVALCEGDDYWHDPLKLQKQVSFLESHPDHVLVHSAFRVQTGEVIEPGPVFAEGIPTGRVFENLLRSNFIATCTVCMRQTVAADYYASSWRTNGYLMDDYPQWLFASQQGLIGYIDEPLATYRCTPGSVMRRTPDAALRMELSARQVKKDFVEQYGSSADALAAGLSTSNLRLLGMAIELADRATFLEEYQWYRRNNPGWRKDRQMLVRFLLFKLGLFTAARNFRRLGPARAILK